MRAHSFLRTVLCCAWLAAAAALHAADADPAAKKPIQFRDPVDGWFDVSEFLDKAYGFLPVVMPITEPAVGYGAAGALLFIDRHVEGLRPNILAVGGLATENGTDGVFAMHLGTWMNGKLRTIAGLADMDINLDFFGLGGDRNAGGSGVGYTINARGGLVGAHYRIGDTAFWAGLRYTRVNTTISLDVTNSGLPEFVPSTDLSLGAVTPSITLDLRDNFFTPTKGWYVDLSVPIFRDAFGSDRDFETATLTAIHYRPVSEKLFFSMRAAAKGSSDDTPFFLRPSVSLRGVQALRYQGEEAAEAEAELRWQVHPRFSAVFFAGAGLARGNAVQSDSDKSVVTGGVGFRYFIARKHGLHMGLDVGFGPDNPILYVVVGNAWLRP